MVLRMFFYAVTCSGWREIRKTVKRWQRLAKGRSVVVYAGTDHALTEPAALEMMQGDKVDVRLMEEYQGVFHPKVVWLEGTDANVVWVGSNNLTKAGLLQNIEFAVVVRSAEVPEPLKRWAEAVAAGSSALTSERLASYASERRHFEVSRAKAEATTFTWSKKKEPTSHLVSDTAIGDLILEVMPRETGTDGTQIQFPRQAVEAFFDLTDVGAQKAIILSPRGIAESRSLTMTVFDNRTVRLSISDLEYRDRPCVIVFRRMGDRRVQFDIVPQSIFPTRYRELLSRCGKRTRKGSRRWAIVESGQP